MLSAVGSIPHREKCRGGFCSHFGANSPTILNLEGCPQFTEFLAQRGLIFFYDGLKPTDGFVESISITIKDHAAEIVDLIRIIVLDPLPLLLEPLIIDLNRFRFSVEIEIDFEFADTVERRTNAAGDTIFRSSSATSTSSGGNGIAGSLADSLRRRIRHTALST